MIHLFKRIYLQPDNDLAAAEGQERIIFTGREYPNPFPDPKEYKISGVVSILKNEDDLKEYYGDLDGFISFLATCNRKICVVVSQENLARLLCSVWKSIFKKPAIESFHKLYRMAIFNQNLFTSYFSEADDVDGLQEDTKLEPMPVEEFGEIFVSTPACAVVKSLKPVDFALEYYLAAYFGGTITYRQSVVLVEKVKQVVYGNIVELLANDRPSFFRYTQNHYLAFGKEEYRFAEDPLSIMEKDPDFKWLFDKNFNSSNLDYVRKNYRLSDLKKIFGQYNALFAKGGVYFDQEYFLDLYIDGDMYALIQKDIEDENANIFAERGFMKKTNGLLISHMYDLVRAGKAKLLEPYELAI